MEYFQFFINLIAVVNPIGALPIFYAMTAELEKQERYKIGKTTAFAIVCILFVSLFFGKTILSAFNLSLDSFRIAGGFIVILIALTMINGKIGEHKINKEEKALTSQGQLDEEYKNIAVVPLAMPIMAGPGSIGSVIVFGSHKTGLELLFTTGVIILFGVTCFILFRYSGSIIQKLGKTGTNIVTRVMGLLLMTLGVEIMTTGIVNVIRYI